MRLADGRLIRTVCYCFTRFGSAQEAASGVQAKCESAQDAALASPPGLKRGVEYGEGSY